jgi:putative transposase
MRRKASELIAGRNEPFIRRIKEIKAEHPFWGYRRTWAHLKYVDKLDINKKRVFRLMQKHELLVKPNMRIKAIRTPSRSKPKPDRPNQWWGIDMTKVMVDGFGWMYLVIVLDWYSKKIVGYNLSKRSKAQDWREALESAVNKQFPLGAREARLKLVSDHGSQPTLKAMQSSLNHADFYELR